jgi:GT2 family glycosyltransferase
MRNDARPRGERPSEALPRGGENACAVHPSEDLERAFELLAARRARLEALSARYGEMQHSRASRLRTLWHFVRALFPLPLRRSRVVLAYEGLAPFPAAPHAPDAPDGSAAADDALAVYFDADYYLARNPDIADAGMRPFEHYVNWGAAENREAHPLFAAAWYAARHPDAARAGGAIRHYAAFGWRERRDPHPAFAAEAYAAATGCAGDALAHYLANGLHGAPDPHPLFDGARYRALRGGRGARAPLADFLADASADTDPHPLFGVAFYRAHSPDAAAAGMHPFAHYLTFGSAEGRAPNRWFDPDWYRAAYPDVAAAGLEPLTHFAVHGWREGRNPSPAFQTAWYAAAHLADRPEVNPLSWHIEHGEAKGFAATALANPAAYAPAEAPAAAPAAAAGAQRPVDVVIPVYRGAAVTRRCVESVLRSDLPAGTRVIVIDDASPERDVSAYVDTLGGDERVTVLRNARNLGFVGTVNRAFRETPGRDAVLLNSDTVVANGWLARLRHAAYAVRAATVTPFSNNATICSFPNAGGSGACDPRDVPLLDAAAAAANADRIVDLPTGVGFCLYVRRDALDEIGLFDEERFGKGYGEEVDFCRRAAKAGWRNVLAADVFVYHEGEVSFAETASPTKARADVVVRGLHPEYEDLVRSFVTADHALAARVALAAEAIRRRGVPIILFVTHALGGGIATHVEQLATKLRDRATVLQLAPGAGRTVRLGAPVWPYVPALEFLAGVQDDDLRGVLRALHVGRAHVHSVVGFPLDVARLLRELGVPFDFTIHDYYAVCPQITMSDPGGVHCGEPDEAGCAACIAGRPPSPLLDITAWRDNHAWLVRDAARVIAPSQDARERMHRYHPDADIVVVPHAL